MSDLYPYALGFARYRQLLEADYARLRSVAPGALERPVPECDGWTGRDVVLHTAEVYLHKAESIRRGVMPQPWPPEGLRERDPLALIDEAHARLVGELDAHEPADPAWTWWPQDQTVGFWVRRMAHETSVHRRDVESAVAEATPVAEDLAVDGIDELLLLMLAGDWTGDEVPTASGSAVVLESGGHVWQVTLHPDRVDVAREQDGGAAATVSGEPGDVLLWLWGRGPRPLADGDPAVVTELRERLALATR